MVLSIEHGDRLPRPAPKGMTDRCLRCGKLYTAKERGAPVYRCMMRGFYFDFFSENPLACTEEEAEPKTKRMNQIPE